MAFTLQSVLDSFRLKDVGTDRYRAENVEGSVGVVYGGQLLAQSIIAASVGHEGKTVKTLHTIFARAGKTDAPLEIDVDRMHSGRAMASSSVTIRQGDRLVARSQVLLSADEDDVMRHADEPVARSRPDEASPYGAEPGDWELRVVGGADIDDPEAIGPADFDVWSRFLGAPDDLTTSQALLAYATDGFLIGTAMRPHQGIGQALSHKTLSTGVLSHTLTFHDPFSASEWLLLSHHSPYAGRGRTYGRADVFQQDGRLVASFVQDNMVRSMRPGAGGL